MGKMQRLLEVQSANATLICDLKHFGVGFSAVELSLHAHVMCLPLMILTQSRQSTQTCTPVHKTCINYTRNMSGDFGFQLCFLFSG